MHLAPGVSTHRMLHRVNIRSLVPHNTPIFGDLLRQSGKMAHS